MRLYNEDDVENIAKAIRGKAKTDKKYSITKMPEGVSEVYDKGFLAFFNKFTDDGKRKEYAHAFSYANFDGVDNLPYEIFPVGAGEVFYRYQGTKIPSGINFSKLDSKSVTVSYTAPYKMFFESKKLEKIQDLNIPSVSSYEHSFNGCEALREIEIIRNTEETTYFQAFKSCKKLHKIQFSRPIGRSIDLGACPLMNLNENNNVIPEADGTYNIDYIKHVVAQLVDYKGTENENKYTLTLSLKSDYRLCEDAGIHYNTASGHKRGDAKEGMTPNKYKIVACEDNNEEKEQYRLEPSTDEDARTILQIITDKGWNYMHLTSNP